MKKKIALLLAIITMINTITVFPGQLMDVFAGPTDKYKLGVRFDNKLIVGKTNPIPLYISDGTGNLAGSDALIEWDFNTPNGLPFDSGVFLLQYPVRDGLVAQMRIDKSVSSAVVTYDVYKTSASYTDTSGNKIYTDSASDGQGKSFFVHSQPGAPTGQENYVPYDAFLNADKARGYYVVQDQIANGLAVQPTFHINRGQGFSFKYENYTVHFLWDSASGRFFVMTNAFAQSTVYPVALMLSSNSPGTANPNFEAAPSVTNVLTGIAEREITSEAISNSKGKGDILNHTGANMESPAEDPNLMKIRMNVPKVWNSAAGEFVYGSTTQIPIQTNLMLTGNASPIQVIIDNIFNPTAAGCRVSGAAFYTGGTPVRKTDAGVAYIEFTLGSTASLGLPYGRLYEGTISFLKTAGTTGVYAFNSNRIGYGKFYTFMRYTISFIGDKYYAIIEPYLGYKGYYRLFVDGEKSVTSYSDGVNPLYMPLAMNAASGFVHTYQVYFSPGVSFESEGSLIVESQIMKYEAGAKAMSIGIANNFKVVSHRYIPFDELSTDPDKDVKGTLKVDLRWDIAREETIKALCDNSSTGEIAVKYVIYSTLEPYATLPDGTPDMTKIRVLDTITMTMKKETDGRVKVTYTDNEGLLAPDDELPTVRYFTGDGSNSNDSRVEYPAKDVIYRAYVRLNTLAFNKNAVTNTTTPPETIDFYFPNIFFLNTKPVELTSYNAGNPVIKILSVGESLYDSMTLDDYSKLQLPLPQNLTAYDPITISKEQIIGGETVLIPQEISMKVKWVAPGGAIREYLDNSYPYHHEEVLFDLFISQGENALKALPAINDPADRVKPPVIAVDFADIYNTTDTVMYFSDINGKTAPKFLPTGVLDTTGDPAAKFIRDYLRDGKVVCIKNVPISLDQNIVNSVLEGASRDVIYKLDGLDKNQRYCFSADLKIDYYNKTDPLAADPVFPDDFTYKKTSYSMITSIVSEITKNDESKPSPEDKFPPAPVLRKDNITLSSATILWDKITETNASGANIVFEYEIIRTKDKEMDAALLDSKADFADIYSAINNTNKAGLRTEGTNILEYSGAGFASPAAGKYEYTIATNSTEISLTDNTLTPNQLYFYYVRTVRKVNNVVLYSVWSNISVTTTPVKPPKNLRVVREAQAISYNKQKEFLIMFDAPIGDIAKLGVDMQLQYSICKDGEDWSAPYTIPVSALTQAGRFENAPEEGYIRFKYIVSKMMSGGNWVDLKSGTSYTIKVRLLDLVNNDASVYSNIDTARTEINQDELDKDIIENKWLEYLKGELKKLVKTYYWYADKSDSQSIIVYRPDMFAELLTQSQGSQLSLALSESERTIYYLPASAILKANETNKGFKIISDDIETLISPNAVDTNYNEAILKIAQKIKDKDIKDYYIRITFEKDYRYGYIENNKPLTPKLTIRFEAAGSIEDTKIVDDEILNALMDRILTADQNDKTIDELREMLDDKESNEELVKFVARVVEKVSDEFMKDVYTIINDNRMHTFELETLASSLMIRYQNAEPGTFVKAYHQLNNIWVSKDVIASGGVYSVTSLIPGTFVFVGYKPSFPKLDGIPGSADIVELIVKYGLDDLLGRDNAFQLDATVSGYAMAGIASRLMGAGKTADPYAFLKSKGYTMSTRTSSSPVSKQEAIFMYMAVYEVRTNTKVATIRITNFGQTAGIKNLNDNYKQAVRAAFQLGICQDKAMDAKASMTVREALVMLLQLKSKAAL